MASKNPIVTQLAREALAQFPKYPTRTLARRLRAKSPEVFHSVEQARKALLTHRGAKGANSSKKPLATRTRAASEQAKRWSTLLPDPAPITWKWHELPADVSRWVILADLHMPYHDGQALRTALYHADGNCDGVLLLGDIMDAYQVSPFCKDPRKRRLASEIDDVKRLLDALAALDGVKHMVYKGGNHSLRVERYVWQHAPELADVPNLTLQAWLELEQRGIQWVPCQEPIRHHALAIVHGHEWGQRFSSPVNPARGAFLKGYECVIQGHEHRTSDHTETTLFGTLVSAWSVGALCDLHAEYRPLGNRWNAGFAYLNTGSSWSIENKRIVNGTEVL